MVDCSSRVLYVPFMSNFQKPYLTSFFIGEGLSALIPSAFALVQGVGGVPECRLVNTTVVAENVTNAKKHQKYVAITPPPLFSVEVFFYTILGVVLISATAFHLLNYKAVVRGALSTAAGDAGYENECRRRGKSVAKLEAQKTEALEMSQCPCPAVNGAANGKESQAEQQQEPSLFVYAVALQLVVCFVSNGILLSIQCK